MTAPAELAAALADRYRIERELGRGGMATVWLAHDLRHDRPVALKLLRGELVAALGPERFLQEIRIAARLRHPHILPVHDSGEAAGRLWYTMPFVEGESLRQRLGRERQLPVGQALRIADQVLSALGYAHAHGIVHRDIKPENILLEGDQAVVADFGVARAISAAGEARLTETGLALGTPAYMSPEQASGGRDLDGRSDVYAFGCVLYEMLAGQPPFQAPTAQGLLARHALDPVPPLRTVRDTVPDQLEEAVVQAMAKAPADRFPTAAAFAEALASAPVTTPASGGRRSVPAPPRTRPKRGLMIAIGAVVVAALVALATYLLWPRPKLPVNANLVAIVPFRVNGASPELNYLREGMIDLVAARLTGEAGARALDPRSVMAAWRRAGGTEQADLPESAALEVARRLGAGQLLLGGVVGTAGHLTLNATLVAPDRARAEAKAEGSADSLPRLVDRLIAQLITEGAGESHGLDGLVDAPLPALRLYLEGQAAARRAEYTVAVDRYSRALDLDSTFALAGLALAGAASWTAIPGGARRGLEHAWAGRDRLSPRDRALVLAEVGPNYPATSTLMQHLQAWEQAANLAPDQPERWYELGDVYFHHGPYLGIAASRRSAADLFRRSVALDSNTSALGHLVEVAVLEGDTSEVRRLGALYLARDTSGELLGFYRWRVAEGLNDTRALDALRGEYGGMRLESLWRIMNHAALDGRRMEDADSAAAAIQASAGRSAEWQRSKTYLHAFLVDRGRPMAALADTAADDDSEYGPHAALYERVLDGLYGNGDSANAGAAARTLAHLVERRPAGPADRAVAATDLCVATLWRLARGETAGAAQAVSRLRARAPDDTPQAITTNTVCATLLEAKLAWMTGTPTPAAIAALDRLDALIRSGPGGQRSGPDIAFTMSPAYARTLVGISPCGFEDFANLEIARMRERQGDLRAALAAVRRRSYAYHLIDYLAPHLREEGRLAALTGDTAGAVAAYRHYLALRSNPEPSVRPEFEAVRAELAKLTPTRQ
jgi:tetratricopeptide (TPR) repeat protein